MPVANCVRQAVRNGLRYTGSAQTNTPGLQRGERLQGLGIGAEAGVADDVLRCRQTNAGQAAVLAVLIGQIAAEGGTIRTGQLRRRQCIGKCPTGQCRIGGTGRIEGTGQGSEIKAFHLLVEQRVASAGIEVGHGFGDHLQIDDGLRWGGGVPVLEGDLVARPHLEHEVVAALAEGEVAVGEGAAEG